MKIKLFRTILLISLFSMLFVPETFAQNQLTGNQALSILVTKIEKDNLYSSWTRMECLSFFPEDGDNGYFDFAIREKHGGKCPGDPNTAPIVDRFRISQTTKEIQWYEPTEGEWVSYVSFKKFRNIK
jgi:hypothetical protein